MLKRSLLYFTFFIAFVHVTSIYLMPNCSHCPASRITGTYMLIEDGEHHKTDTASETPYKVKYRTLLVSHSAKKISVAIKEPLNLLVGCLTFKLEEFVFAPVKKVFHFNLSYLRIPPDLIFEYCCFLI